MFRIPLIRFIADRVAFWLIRSLHPRELLSLQIKAELNQLGKIGAADAQKMMTVYF